MTTGTNTNSHWLGGAAQARELGRAWAVAQGRGAQQWASAIASGFPKTWGAERERSASTHATRLQNGELCM
eukprot:6185759-Pleurochrysis_carterae.AAC.1